MFLRHFGTHVAVRTPAKLNLFLEVLGRRADGYHELETLMTTVGVYDRLLLAPRDDGALVLSCGWSDGLGVHSRRALRAGKSSAYEPLPTGPENLVVRAVERLRQRSGEARGATLALTKSIPAAAGLGGASADAAAALAGANALWHLGWSPARLAEVAAEIGSDVSFFLGAAGRAAGAAVCRGRGERIEPLTGVARLPVVIIRPPVGLSTARVYRACQPAATPVSVAPLIEALQDGDLRRLGAAMHNRLEAAAAQLCPWIARLRAWCERFDLVGHQMSGSGTSYFGICRHARQARRLASLARQAGLGAVFAASTPAC